MYKQLRKQQYKVRRMTRYCLLDICVCAGVTDIYCMNTSLFLFETICVCVFIVKTKGYNVTVLTYVNIRVCVGNRKMKKTKLN